MLSAYPAEGHCSSTRKQTLLLRDTSCTPDGQRPVGRAKQAGGKALHLGQQMQLEKTLAGCKTSRRRAGRRCLLDA